MGDVIDDLLSHPHVTRSKPASAGDIGDVAYRFGDTFPHLLLKLWHASDGVLLEQLDAHVLGPMEIMFGVLDRTWTDDLIGRGFLPLLDDHQSNYLVLSMRGPLAHRVIHLPHDDSSRVLFRDVSSFLASLLGALDRDQTADEFLRETAGDYAPDAPRSAEDQNVAIELMRTKNEQDEWNLAAQLLDVSNLSEWATLLETDHFVRRDVRARMQKMTAPAIRELLHKDEEAFEAFADLAALEAQRAGLSARRGQGHTLQVNTKAINLESFFHRRNIPDAVPRMIAWFQDAVAGRNPQQRLGHFMVD